MSDKQSEKAKPRIPNFERMYHILEYLKKNTDREHPITQKQLCDVKELDGYIIKGKDLREHIRTLAVTVNNFGEEYKPVRKWKLVYDDLIRIYGDPSERKEYLNEDIDDLEDDDEDDDDGCIRDKSGRPVLRVRGLYYNQTFSYEDVNNLIEGVMMNKAMDTKSANALVKKIEENLTTVYYKEGPKKICKVREPELMDRGQLRKNLSVIQQAIDDFVQISFRFNGYNYRKEFVPFRETKDTVSPYYIVASGGRYYLLACKEFAREGQRPFRNMSIWRIDLMTEIEIVGKNEKLGFKGKASVPKRDVKNLPMEWSDDFQLSHLNMSFDKPVPITLRIQSVEGRGGSDKRKRPDYTFLHDWFGDTFRYVRTEKEPPFGDIVKVKCSPYGMVNWALQYSDRVEVLEPLEVRAQVMEKIRNLNHKYGMNEIEEG